MPEPMSGCWIWLGNFDRRRYGRIGRHKKHYSAHRVAYEIYRGQIPEGLCVCHLCDNPYCVNPDHLWLGTKSENTLDRDKKGRGNFGFVNREVARRACKAANHFGRKRSEETIQRIKDAVNRPESIAKISSTHKGKCLSQETKQKISETKKALGLCARM